MFERFRATCASRLAKRGNSAQPRVLEPPPKEKEVAHPAQPHSEECAEELHLAAAWCV